MTPLEALEALARDARGNDYADEREQAEWFDIVDDALDALSPRVVTTAEELDTLPVGSVVIDYTGDAHQSYADVRGGNRWLGVWDDRDRDDSRTGAEMVAKIGGTFTVVWAPQQGPDPTPLGH